MLTVLIFVICYAIAQIRDLPSSPPEEKNRIRVADLFDQRDGLIIVIATGGLIALWLAGIVSPLVAVAAGVVIALSHVNFVSRRFSFRKGTDRSLSGHSCLADAGSRHFSGTRRHRHATEISVFAVVYALLVGLLIYRDLTMSTILRCVLTPG